MFLEISIKAPLSTARNPPYHAVPLGCLAGPAGAPATGFAV